ncbi:MAG TPA: hypothetical protein PKM66_07255 [Nitrosomonas sp.]|nr:hypothetical protein [Nitrosomonas sp.]HNM72844.1 hypothetical protein [Nitrosomonas sp.]
MRTSLKPIKGILIYTLILFTVSLIYFIYAFSVYPSREEQETYLHEIGEGFGKTGLALLGLIYFRTFLKLLLGKGKLAQRLLPEYQPPFDANLFDQLLGFLNRTHVYVGIAAVAILLLHAAMMGLTQHLHILFFPALLALIIWQALFGLFLTWRYSTTELKQFSYLVHAQFVTGIAIGIFAFFGHILIDD